MAASEEMAPLHQVPDGHPEPVGGKVGVVLANLGTPNATDYWSVRRYLSEFLSDRRVVDYSPWLWQPLLQLVILSRRPFASGKAYRGIWNRERDESPLLTITASSPTSSPWNSSVSMGSGSKWRSACATAIRRPRAC
ncbi:ferrochelatase [Halomonas elongata]|uniref:Ferrochelatase n=1 Tax=Halomonas elongata TaxID=2746 RepID=A0A1B8NW14_HALEL|nr:ferrochelatase [Halomonas elongata]